MANSNTQGYGLIPHWYTGLIATVNSRTISKYVVEAGL